MHPWRRLWSGLLPVAALTVAGGCGGDDISSPLTNGGPPDPPDPPSVSVPTSPTDVLIRVQANSALVSWTPGDGASTQDVVLSSADGREPDRIEELTYVTTGTNHASFEHLTWGASYRLVVAALNEAGRTESAPTGFEVPLPEAPVLNWFSASRDPTCLVVEWTAAAWVKRYRVILSAESEAASFEKPVSWTRTEVEVCAAQYPIVDGMIYEARVVGEFDGLELESNSREFTVDFGPEYSVSGVWRGGSTVFDQYWPLTLDLVEVEGEISGSWTDWLSTGRVEGRRLGLELELIFDGREYMGREYDSHLSGYMAGPDRIEGTVWPGLVYRVLLERE